MTMSNYVAEKAVKRDELRGRFRLLKEFDIVRGDLSKCGNCGDTANTKSLPAESWTSALYCWKCGSMTVMIHADRMSGNHTDCYEVYGA